MYSALLSVDPCSGLCTISWVVLTHVLCSTSAGESFSWPVCLAVHWVPCIYGPGPHGHTTPGGNVEKPGWCRTNIVILFANSVTPAFAYTAMMQWWMSTATVCCLRSVVINPNSGERRRYSRPTPSQVSSAHPSAGTQSTSHLWPCTVIQPAC